MSRTLTDEELLLRVREGDGAAFGVLHARYRAELERFARGLLHGDEALAEDVVQDAFVCTHQLLVHEGRALALRPWLYRVVRNGAINERRRKRNQCVALDARLPAPARMEPPVVAACNAEVRGVLAGIARLPVQQREALVAHAVHGRHHDAIARDMGITAGASKALVHRARGTLHAAAA